MRYKKCNCEKIDVNRFTRNEDLCLLAEEYCDSLLSFYYYYCKRCSRIWRWTDCDFGNSWEQISWKRLHKLAGELIDLPQHKCDFTPE
ncbi:hypothetical protein [Candidatus Uabimicrobium amorphum]|uniref:Uncharacterized protein n=2 Tax=Uabimicrobium amorphum TaxID=2596890 RepID=A0A5S9IPE8_UABAM|nr:hypothetical protein UABAM_03993 [Candidatus Uabimicrobium amorphum]